jgi:hypothetical protein
VVRAHHFVATSGVAVADRAVGRGAAGAGSDTAVTTDTRLYGPAMARSWNRLHPRLTHRASWATRAGKLPVIEGTVIQLDVDRLPSGTIPKPVWLWHSEVDLDPTDIEHTFRMLKQTLGWACPKPETGSR